MEFGIVQLLPTDCGEVLPESQGSDPIFEELETLPTAGSQSVAQYPACGRQDLRPRLGRRPGAPRPRYDRHLGGIPRLYRGAVHIPGAVGFR